MKKLLSERNIKIISYALVCIFSVFLLLKFPSLSTEGIRKGLELCAGTMIPSLFPFLVISSFAVSSGLLELSGSKTEKFFRKTMGLSPAAGMIVFFSVWSGFPVGCSMASSLLSQNKISVDEAKRIMLSSVNAGPAFVICAVGTMMMSSLRAGIIIYASLTIASLIITFISRFILPDCGEKNKTVSSPSDFSEALVTSVYNASKSMFTICGWILLFSCFLNIMSGKIENENISTIFNAIAEVSLGCKNFSKTASPVILSAVIGWGGLCVHCQVLPFVRKSGLKVRYFFCGRLLHSMLSALICAGLVKIFPCDISVFSSGTPAISQTFAVSAPAAAGLLIMCAIFVLDLDTHKKMC